MGGAVILKRYSPTQFFHQTSQSSVESPTLEMSGQIVNPLTLEGVAGIDLVAGATTVRTGESGQYAFGTVTRSEGIQLTAPGLLRALTLLPPEGKDGQSLPIYFATDLFDTLALVIESESRGRFEEVYASLTPEVQAKIARDTYTNQARSIFDTRNVTDQTIAITQTQLGDNFVGEVSQILFPKVVQITVLANGKTAVYAFTHTDTGWKLVQ